MTSAIVYDFIALTIVIADSFSLVAAVVLLLVVDIRLRRLSGSYEQFVLYNASHGEHFG